MVLLAYVNAVEVEAVVEMMVVIEVVMIVMLGLCWGKWDLQSFATHVESSFLDQGSSPGPLPWEGGVCATGPPGNSQEGF